MILYVLNRSYERALAGDIANAVAYAAFAVVGFLIAARRPGNAIGWLFGAIVLSTALTFLAEQYGQYALITNPDSLPGGLIAAWVSSWSWVPAVVLPGTFLLLLFPDGRLPSPRWSPVAWLAGCAIAMLILFAAFSPSPLGGVFSSYANPTGIEGLRSIDAPVADILDWLLLGVLLASAISAIVRFRRSRGEERQQMKWFAYAAAMMVVLFVLNGLFGGPGNLFFGLGVTLLPIATGIAILKYRLYDIDLIINRTLVYGALTACVAGLYVLVVGGLGALLQARGSLLISLLATGLVAVLFVPLRDRLQRGVNRLMYGERDDPYGVLSRLGQRLEMTLEPHTVLPAVAETVAHALKLPHVAIELKRGDEYETTAQYGRPTGEALRLPLVYGTETVGRIVLSPRAPGEAFGPADRRLLDDLARQAGIVAHAVRLANDLQRSREHLVTAREEERRRIRRNLHDGLGPALSSAMLKLGAARRLLPPSSPADDLIVEVRDDMRATVTDVRRLVYDLRPPALDQLGLVLAIRDYAEQYVSDSEAGMRVTVEPPESDSLPPLPAAVEVAAYNIAREAITNAARHAQARSCRIRLTIEDVSGQPELVLEISDDGVGMPAERRSGVGLTSMRERVEELGGTCAVESPPGRGTRVLACLPVGKE